MQKKDTTSIQYSETGIAPRLGNLSSIGRTSDEVQDVQIPSRPGQSTLLTIEHYRPTPSHLCGSTSV
ncbi:hypothetical protein IAQ61_004992 [Plenodomus lingam]|uniref:uncharacterized protein n=1 Tax=Leptosphaeria maculans TaxID=5022 RepID=UPI0033203DAB|nr:hypothetical protein IAQ61_004992 [Plenodomus lingam]